MGGFNPINLIINTMSVYASYNEAQNQNANNNLVQNQGVLNQGQQVNSANTSSFTPLNYASQNTSLQAQSQLSSANQLLISTVELEQRANYVKDLLNLPRDFETLINQIQNTTPEADALKQLSKLLQNGKINLNALSTLLSDNSKGAIQKLMVTIMTVSKMGSNNVNQLKELIGMFSSASANTETTQVIKNILMLYLPWLPLSVRHDMNLDFNIDIFDKIQGADPDMENAAEMIKIMIQTANYGNILATLELSLNNEIDVFISAIESFPEDEVLKEFKKENKKSSIRSNVTVEKNKDPNMSEHIKQNIKISSSDYVSPKLVLAAHSLIKIIIEVDNKEFIINEETE